MTHPSYIKPVEFIWMDGKLVPWADANVHILTHTLHYGLGTFEGIRCYRTSDGRSAVFRLAEHIERFMQSAHIVGLPMPFDRGALISACCDTVRANKLPEAYIRPLAFIGDGAMGLGATTNPTRVSIITWTWGAYLGDEGLKKGVRAKISSFTRPGINMLMSRGKIVGHYVNSILAKREAVVAGYDEAILLDAQGFVAEASGENIFVVSRGKVVTPPVGGAILSGITRDSVLTLLRDAGIEVTERALGRDELYVADEVFFTGTAAEVTPVREIDNRQIGEGTRGPITERIQSAFFAAVRGDSQHKAWLTYV